LNVVIDQDTYDIRLPQFEGPFDLLLFFIERDELDIHEIAIAKITDDFLSYMLEMNALNIELASEFIFVAATLMRIKARTLLPRQEPDEDGNELNTRRDLIQKLIDYKHFKQISEKMYLLEESRRQITRRGNILADLSLITENAEPAEELSSLGLYKLLIIYKKALAKYQAKNTTVVHTVAPYPYTIAQQKEVITQLLQLNKQMDFSDMKKHSANKVQFVYNFLAVLEMLQQQLISIQTGPLFNDFRITGKTFPENNLQLNTI